MNQLDFYNTNIDWEATGPFLLLAIALLMIALFKRDSSDTQKAMKVGVGFFIVTMVLNIIGLTKISDGFSLFGFVIVAIGSLRLFWSDTN